MAQKVPKMPENGQNSCTKEKNGRNKRSIQGVKSTKQSKLLCSSKNLMFYFNLKGLGFKRNIFFTPKIGNLQNFYLAQSDIMTLFLAHIFCFTILFICNLHYVKVLYVTFSNLSLSSKKKLQKSKKKVDFFNF